jgi:hypothetical protein
MDLQGRLAAPALFLWASENGRSQSGHGVIRDINASGVYIQADSLPAPGALVQLDILLPKMVNSGPGMHLCGEGAVLRVERGCGKGNEAKPGGFAVSVQFYPNASDWVISNIPRSVRVV